VKTCFSTEVIDRLARRVLAGEVVFFIGSGFSLDSEKNTVDRWVGRLLARFLAMARYLSTEPPALHACEMEKRGANLKQQIRDRAAALMQELATTFGLEGKVEEPACFMTAENVKRLRNEYYPFNEWICSAFGLLLGDVSSLTSHQKMAATIHGLENYFLALLGSDPVDLQEIELDRLLELKLPAERGKALFLDTMGFDDERIMGGKPMDGSFLKVVDSYRGRLLKRHHVLARLAREGLCPVLLTTNYDLLLEGAYRLAGMSCFDSSREPAGAEPQSHRRESPLNLVPTQVPFFARIAKDSQFFSYGYGHSAALVVKIHGCVENYRQEKRCGVDAWRGYLSAIIFTFREIQNWRKDAWSRDYVRTLLRTRTMAFCGFSGVDPVLHNTFREVYDEMALRNGPRREPGEGESLEDKESDPTDADQERSEAPAFFMDLVDNKTFHSREILSAASRAVGETLVNPGDHPNFLGFSVRPPERFPRLDDLFLWLYHRVYRERQWQVLKTDLRGIASLLLGHPCPEHDRRAIEDNLAELICVERKASQAWGEDPAVARRQFRRIVGWTDHWQVGLLREFAMTQAVLSNRGPGLELARLRAHTWYQPIHDNPPWAAWAVVVELAIRRMVATWRGKPKEWPQVCDWVDVSDSLQPTLRFSKGAQEPTPFSLTIALSSFERVPRMPRAGEVFRRQVYWRLRPEGIPWRPVATPRRNGQEGASPDSADRSTAAHEYRQSFYGSTPAADVLWKWASGSEGREERAQLEIHLGVDSEQ